METIVANNDIDRLQWNHLLERSHTASPFQTPEYYDFCKQLAFLEPFVFGVAVDNQLQGIISGYLIAEGNGVKNWLSRRAIIHGGVLLSENIIPSVLEILLKHTIQTLSSKAIYIEIRNYFDYSKYRRIFEQVGFKYEPHLNFHVNTPDTDTAFANLSMTKRRNIRIGIKNGAEVITNPTPNEIGEYYNILSDIYRHKIKRPLFPKEFFEKLVESPLGKFFLIRYNGEISGGSVCLELKNRLLYEFFVCGADRKLRNISPSTLATWAAIEYAAKNGFSHFDMMGAGKPNNEYGVREFKSKFGGDLVDYGRFSYICNPILFAIAKLGLNLIKRINFLKI